MNMKYKCPTCDGELKSLEDGTELHCDACGKKIAKKDAKPFRQDGVTRLDIRDVSWDNSTEPMTETPEGFLKGRVAVTNVGVFSYTQPGGVVRRELRLPEEVFAQASLESLRMKPLTSLHPKSRVNSENVKDLAVGSVGESVYTDPYRVYAPIVITDAKAVKDAREKLSAVSCGYDCDLEYVSGVWMGQPYDCIQRNIRYNHLALVPKGRAGDDVSLRFDSAEDPAYWREDSSSTQPPPQGLNPSKEEPMKTLHIDGVEYQAEAPVVAALHQAGDKIKGLESKLTEDAAEASKVISTVTAERDSYKERAEKAEADLKMRQDAAPADIEAQVKSRLALHDAARKAGVEFKLDSAESEIQLAVIAKAFPKADLTGKDASYISARFDSACEFLASEAGADATARHDASDIPGSGTPLTNVDAEEEARKRSHARITNSWQDKAQG
jgi:DNA-directed RNA polymerase subunit RPC12/RpoP